MRRRQAHAAEPARYANVFALGDSAGLPTSKTGAAIRKQAPVLVANLRAAMQGRPLTASYDGYSSCPVVTGYGKMMLAEFDYDEQARRVVSLRPVEGAVQHVASQDPGPAAALLARHAPRPGLNRRLSGRLGVTRRPRSPVTPCPGRRRRRAAVRAGAVRRRS